METVWVVEQGRYSDYRVVGVYSAKENAEKVAAIINAPGSDSYDAAVVRGWPLNPGIEQLNAGLSQWFVRMTRDGGTERVEKQELNPSLTKDDTGLVKHWVNGRPQAGLVLHAYEWATDAMHAVKIVNERRTQMIAMGEWPIGT